MLDIKPFIGGKFYESDISKKLSGYLLAYKLISSKKLSDYYLVNIYKSTPAKKTGTLPAKKKPAKKTGTLMGMKTFNHIFNKFNADYYQLFIHNYGNKKLLFSELGHWARIQKIKKYYTEGYYQNIKDIIIQGENKVTPLLEALALWVDYDLIKDYYKGFDIEKIDKILWLWSKHYFNYYHSHEKTTSEKSFELKYNLQDKDLLSMKPKFNLFRFVWLLYKDEIPLVYKDGVLIIDKYNMFKDLSIYNANSVETAVKNIIKTLLNKNLNLNDFLYGYMWNYMGSAVIDAFPYLFVFGWTGYGYALNVYKFNPDIMGFKPVKYFVVERPFIGSEDYLNNIKFVNVNDISDMTGLINKLVKFWFDDEYMYFYAYYEGFIYKVKRSEVEFVRVDGMKYYFRVLGKLIRIKLLSIYSFSGLVTYAEDG